MLKSDSFFTLFVEQGYFGKIHRHGNGLTNDWLGVRRQTTGYLTLAIPESNMLVEAITLDQHTKSPLFRQE